MEIKLTSSNSYTQEITVEVAWDELAPEYDKTERQIIKNIKMPGFRPGKVPRKVILQQYQGAIEAQFVDEAIQKYYSEALQENNIIPVNQGKVEDINFKHGEPLSFKATFEIEPEIELPELKKNSLKIQRTAYESDDEDINEAVKELQERFAEVRSVEDGAKEGHFLAVDLQKLDSSGVAIIGEKMEKQYIKIGDGQFSGEKAKNLLGLKPGDTARLEIPESDDGKTSLYEITVLNVEEQVLPEVTADFIKQIDPEAKDEADWRNRIKERIDHNLDHRAKEEFDRELSNAMIDLVSPEYPPSMVEAYLDRVIEDAKQNNPANLDEARIRELYRPMAENNLKWYLIHNAIIKQQQLEAGKEEVEAEIQQLVDRTPESEKEIRKFYRKPSNHKKLEDDLIARKIQDYLEGFSKIKEVKVKTRDLREQAAKEGK